MFLFIFLGIVWHPRWNHSWQQSHWAIKTSSVYGCLQWQKTLNFSIWQWLWCCRTWEKLWKKCDLSLFKASWQMMSHLALLPGTILGQYTITKRGCNCNCKKSTVITSNLLSHVSPPKSNMLWCWHKHLSCHQNWPYSSTNGLVIRAQMVLSLNGSICRLKLIKCFNATFNDIYLYRGKSEIIIISDGQWHSQTSWVQGSTGCIKKNGVVLKVFISRVKYTSIVSV